MKRLTWGILSVFGLKDWGIPQPKFLSSEVPWYTAESLPQIRITGTYTIFFSVILTEGM
jgi:hypothetical protein